MYDLYSLSTSGEYWGEQGWFRVVRGQNQLLIEEEGNCAWAVPGNWTTVETQTPVVPPPHPRLHSAGKSKAVNYGAAALGRARAEAPLIAMQ
jgi:hypothetical protein